MKSFSKPGSFFDQRVRLSSFLVICFVLLLVIGWQIIQLNIVNEKIRLAKQALSDCPPTFSKQYRMSDYKFARPLLLTDLGNEVSSADPKLNEIKSGIAAIIDGKKESGQIMSASVYLRRFSKTSWISVNGDERYRPASLGKVPMLITYLRDAELKPGLLEKELYFEKPFPQPNKQYFPDESIKPGRNYTIRQLLYYMIVKSDNDATDLLSIHANGQLFTQLFTSLGLPNPDKENLDFQMNAADYSKFFRVLYNATYLSNEDADYALSLLAQSDFKEGMISKLPSDVIVAHKFGEAGNEQHPELGHQLHESGILYINDDPVLLTVMTKGKDIHQLPQVIGEISKYVYDKLKEGN